jgi:hypothetical protein
MANTATLLSLLQRSAALADMLDFSTTTFVTKIQAAQWVNDELAKIHYLLADAGGEYFKSSEDTDLIAGTSAYALPATFYKTLGMDYIDGSGNRFRMGRYGWQERDKYQEAGGVYSGIGWAEYEYNIIGSQFELIPTPGSGSVRLYYVPHYTRRTYDSDPVNSAIPEGWEEYAVLGVAAKCLIKEESDASNLLGLQATMWQMMQNSARPRDQGEPKKTIDIYGRFSRGTRLARWP